MHLVLHSDRGTLWICRSLWATRPTSEPVLYFVVCSTQYRLWVGASRVRSRVILVLLCYTCVVVLHTVQVGASWVWSEAPPHLPSCVIKLLPRRPHRSSPPRNYEYFVGPRCIQPASSTYHRLVSQISKPKKLSRAVVWGSSGLMQTCDLRLELEWAWSVTLPISGTPLRLEE